MNFFQSSSIFASICPPASVITRTNLENVSFLASSPDAISVPHLSSSDWTSFFSSPSLPPLFPYSFFIPILLVLPVLLLFGLLGIVLLVIVLIVLVLLIVVVVVVLLLLLRALLCILLFSIILLCIILHLLTSTMVLNKKIAVADCAGGKRARRQKDGWVVRFPIA